MSRGTVLIVDDEEEICTTLARVVRQCGFDVLTVADGEQATAALGTMDVDIVLTDLFMPRLNGYELIHWMHEHNLAQPVLVLTGYSTLENAVQALRLGAYDYIAKPFHIDEVEAALSRAEASVERRRTHAELRQRNRELAALNAISAAVNSSLELDEMLHRALSAIVEALELTGAMIYRADSHANGMLRLHHSYSPAATILCHLPTELPPPRADGIALGVSQVAQMLRLPQEMLQCPQELVQAAIPLLDQGTLCGVLVLIGVPARPLRHNQLALLTSIGNYIGVGIANTRLYSEVRNSALLLEQAVDKRTQQLQRSRDLLRTIFDGIPGGLLLVDTRGQVLAVNRAYARLFDRSPQSLVNQLYSQIWLTAWSADVAHLLQRCLTTGEAVYQRSRLERPDRSPIVIDHYLFAVRDAHGTITQVIEYLEDMTERLALERALTQAEQIAALGKLAATIAHEVNTPLLAIRGCLGLIANLDNDVATRAECLALAESELDRAATIIRVMLDFYQSTGNDRRAIDVNPLIERVAQLLRAEVAKHNIEVQLNLAPGLPAIMIIPDQLKQVVLNLMLNAIEALPDGGRITLRTSLRAAGNSSTAGDRDGLHHARRDLSLAFSNYTRTSPGSRRRHVCRATHARIQWRRPAFVVIEVEDTGRGIHESLQEKIFDAFVTTKPNGSGMGLAVSRTLVHEQGGTISVANLPDGGARFTVAFPAFSREKRPYAGATAYHAGSTQWVLDPEPSC